MKKGQYFLGLLITSLFGTSIVITAGYVSQYISLIGYNTQLIPLFSGLLVGIFLFSVAGALVGKRLNHGIVYGVFISAFLFIAVFETIAVENFVIANNLLVILSVFISSGYMPVTAFVIDNMFPEMGLRSRTLFAIFASVLSLIVVVLVALIYELSGQDTMTTEITLVGAMSILLLLIFYIQAARKGAVQGN